MDFNTDFKMCYSEYPQYFKKLFSFQKTKEWLLPDQVFKAPKFDIPETQAMKIKLNSVKGQLSEFDLAQWSKHTQNRDIAGYVMDHLRKKAKPELMTQAWCKFYEIIKTLSVISDNISTSEIFTSLHLCEAPGAFVCALNHYLTLEYPNLQWKWMANTLNPNYEGTPLSQMITDDRLIRHTLSNWLFGLDFTGDIQKYYNHEEIVKGVNSNEKVSFITADGSINCMSDPGEQERLVEFLHYCETMTALAVLKKGGSFVLKIFTIFEDSTICLLYLLNCVFKLVSVFKPCTSKSGNSEVYVICKEFVGWESISHIWEDLVSPYKRDAFDKNTSMFQKDNIPSCFYLQVLNCVEYFMERQISTIKDNIYYYLNHDKTESAVLHKLKLGIANEYLRRFRLKHIPSYRKIVPYINVHLHKRKFEENDVIIFLSKNCLSIHQGCVSNILDIKTGKRVDKVHNSKFILKNNLENLLKYCEQKNESPKMLYNLALNYLSQNYVIFNIIDFNMVPYHDFQKNLFFRLKETVFRKKNLILINIPFHTHFLAGLWCIVATMYEKVYFFPGLTIFCNFLQSTANFGTQVFHEVDKLYQNLLDKIFMEDILQILETQAFDHKLNMVNSVLNVCNTPCVYHNPIK